MVHSRIKINIDLKNSKGKKTGQFEISDSRLKFRGDNSIKKTHSFTHLQLSKLFKVLGENNFISFKKIIKTIEVACNIPIETMENFSYISGEDPDEVKELITYIGRNSLDTTLVILKLLEEVIDKDGIETYDKVFEIFEFIKEFGIESVYNKIEELYD